MARVGSEGKPKIDKAKEDVDDVGKSAGRVGRILRAGVAGACAKGVPATLTHHRE